MSKFLFTSFTSFFCTFTAKPHLVMSHVTIQIQPNEEPKWNYYELGVNVNRTYVTRPKVKVFHIVTWVIWHSSFEPNMDSISFCRMIRKAEKRRPSPSQVIAILWLSNSRIFTWLSMLGETTTSIHPRIYSTLQTDLSWESEIRKIPFVLVFSKWNN